MDKHITTLNGEASGSGAGLCGGEGKIIAPLKLCSLQACMKLCKRLKCTKKTAKRKLLKFLTSPFTIT